MMYMFRSLTAALCLPLLAGTAVMAETHEVQMLNFGEMGGMVFEPGYLKVAPGDTITFVPTNKTHWVRGEIQPEGTEKLKSELDATYSVTLEKEGVYVYSCPPHLMMSMVGVIQVGEAVNLEQVNAETPGFSRRLRQNSGRLQTYLDQIK